MMLESPEYWSLTFWDIEIPSTWYVYDYDVYDLNFNIYVVTLHLLFDLYYIFSFWLFMIASIIEFYVFL